MIRAVEMLPAIPLLFFLAASPEQRAIDYLSREVSKWSRENHCFSCHNNGDGARVLLVAKRSGHTVPDAILADTLEWLAQPRIWDKSKENPGFNNTKLAAIQFAGALAEARRADRGPLLEAAEQLVRAQDSDGAWRIDTGGLPAAPAIYGPALGTYMARRTLEAAGAARFQTAIARANEWLTATAPVNVLDAAAMLLALPRSEAVRKKCVDLILRSQTGDGGWGPQPRAPAEAFDTAVVILALHAAGITEPVARGRTFLIGIQQSAGGWPETTRPSGGISYAEHISTTAWVLYALIETAK